MTAYITEYLKRYKVNKEEVTGRSKNDNINEILDSESIYISFEELDEGEQLERYLWKENPNSLTQITTIWGLEKGKKMYEKNITLTTMPYSPHPQKLVDLLTKNGFKISRDNLTG